MSDKNVANLRIENRVVYGQNRSTGETEHDLNVTHLKALDESLSAGQFHGSSP
jgi:hypothetical protein